MEALTVQGCAGSGKTLMALRQVKRLAKNSDVKRILFTCYNRELGQWLARKY
jgi:superfamily I DNA and RNA helicase